MPLSNAERQKAYRARRALAGTFGDDRLNLWVDGRAANALKRLAAHRRTTQRAVIEQLLIAADAAVITEIAPASAAWTAYFAARRGSAGEAGESAAGRTAAAADPADPGDDAG